MDNTGILIIAALVAFILYLLRDRIVKFVARVSLKDQSGDIEIEAAKPQKPQAVPSPSTRNSRTTSTATRIRQVFSRIRLRGKGIHIDDVKQVGSRIDIDTKD